MKSQRGDDTSDEYLFLKQDIFQNTIASLRILLSDERLTPGQISSIAKIILALGSPPGANPGINVYLDLGYETPGYSCQINIDRGDLINVSGGGSIPGDSYTDIDVTFYTFYELFEKDLVKLYEWEATFQNLVRNWSNIDLVDSSDDQKINWDAWPALNDLDDDSGE